MQTLNAKMLADRITTVAEPVFTWLGPNGQERIELSGPVARRWLAKTDNFMDSEFPYGGNKFITLLPCHWRSAFWIIVPWLRGFQLQNQQAAEEVDLIISNDLGFLEAAAAQGGPSTLVAQTQDSLALSWPGVLPPTVLDGIADVMTFGDWVENPFTAKESQLVGKDVSWLPQNLWSHPDRLGLNSRSLQSLDLLGNIVTTRAQEPVNDLDVPAVLQGARVLVTTDNLTLFSAQLIQLWLAGARVVWAPGDGIPTDIIAQQECAFQVVALP